MGRHKDLTHRRSEALSSASLCITIENFINWWIETDLLHKSNGFSEILQDKNGILNADETGLIFNLKPKRIVQEKGAKESYVTEAGGSKVSVTLMCTVSIENILELYRYSNSKL